MDKDIFSLVAELTMLEEEEKNDRRKIRQD